MLLSQTSQALQRMWRSFKDPKACDSTSLSNQSGLHSPKQGATAFAVSALAPPLEGSSSAKVCGRLVCGVVVVVFLVVAAVVRMKNLWGWV